MILYMIYGGISLYSIIFDVKYNGSVNHDRLTHERVWRYWLIGCSLVIRQCYISHSYLASRTGRHASWISNILNDALNYIPVIDKTRPWRTWEHEKRIEKVNDVLLMMLFKLRAMRVVMTLWVLWHVRALRSSCQAPRQYATVTTVQLLLKEKSRYICRQNCQTLSNIKNAHLC